MAASGGPGRTLVGKIRSPVRLSPRASETLVSVVIGVASIPVGLGTAATLSKLGLRGEWTQPEGSLRQIIVVTAALLPLALFALGRHVDRRSLGLTRERFGRSVFVGVTLGLTAVVGYGKSSALLDGLQLPELYALIAASAVGSGEELLWRGYVQGRAIRWLGTSRGIALTAVLFGLSHIPQRLVTGVSGLTLIENLLIVTLIAIVFGVLMRLTSNVVAPSIVHAMNDWAYRL